MGIGESWVDLNGPCIALQRSIDVLHLFQRVSHIAVSIGKRWLDSS